MKEEKEQKRLQREQEAIDKKKREEEKRLAEERKEEEEKKRKADEKVQREKEKKMLRKAKQAFKRYVSDALQELLEKEHALEDEVDLVCSEMDRMQLTELNEKLDGKSASEIVTFVKKRVEDLRRGVKEENGDLSKEASANKSNQSSTKETTSSIAVTTTVGTTSKKVPFTKEELSALAKGIKKFPPGGANRWDQIANYINNSCRPEDPRTKEECIETFNQINKAVKPNRNGNTDTAPTKTSGPVATGGENPATATTSSDTSDGWTAEQDQQLQNGLAKYPATMEKNERWSKIAQEVPGKSKKDCVQRFKEIRNAIKAKK
jgi:DnaJ family protein C protein 2